MISQTGTHATLLARLAEGPDSAAWDEFWRRYGDLVRGFASRQGLQPSDCDDILQEIMMKLVQSMPGFTYDPARGKFRSYLKTIVLRAIFQRFPQKRRFRSVEDIDAAVDAAGCDLEIEETWETEWRRYHLRQAMRSIEVEFSAKDISAFQAYAVDGNDVQTTAAALGLTTNQVYQAKSRILKRLSELIERQIEEEG
jgi:RNA polymerase sigma-70 factor (ECF subfamily)